MEYAEGGTLAQHMLDAQDNLSIEEIIRIFFELLKKDIFDLKTKKTA